MNPNPTHDSASKESRRLTEFKTGSTQYDYDTRLKRYIDDDSKADEWEPPRDSMVWSKQDVEHYLEAAYPQYIGLESMSELIYAYGEMAERCPMFEVDLGLSMLKHYPQLQNEYDSIHMPDTQKRLEKLESRVSQLESLIAKEESNE